MGPEPRGAGRVGRAGRMLFVLAVTIVLGGVLVWVGATFGVRGVLFAFAVNWVAMCWLGTVRLVVEPPLPESYFEIRSFERSGLLYERLGVRLVKLAVRRGPLHLFNPRLRLPPERSPERLRELEQRMREPEAAHVWLFVAMVGVAVHGLARGWWWAAAWTTAFNVVCNAYPVMLQRYNRRWLLHQICGTDRPANHPPEAYSVVNVRVGSGGKQRGTPRSDRDG